MRSPSLKTREVIFDNFTCQVKDHVRDQAIETKQNLYQGDLHQKLGGKAKEFESG